MQRKLSSSLVTQSFGSSTHSRHGCMSFLVCQWNLIMSPYLLRLGTFETKHDGTKYGEEYDSIQSYVCSMPWHARAHTHAHTTFFLDKWKLPFSNKRKRQARTGCSAPLACSGDQCNPTASVEFAETGQRKWDGVTIHVGRKATQKMPPLENPVARIRLVLLDRC
ncbi:hypothetical protein QR685DRAFT_595639 [Neurospora intermedia]|uniref:Questionable protein n=1 Tax=Neurospora intermedia TaxID=5142 RepID=A0ABR3DQ50_NEUIN